MFILALHTSPAHVINVTGIGGFAETNQNRKKDERGVVVNIYQPRYRSLELCRRTSAQSLKAPKHSGQWSETAAPLSSLWWSKKTASHYTEFTL